MTSTPLPYVYEGAGVFRASSGFFARRADQEFEKDNRYLLAEIQERSPRSHSHYFASLNEAWTQLPENISARFPSAEHLRKTALIETGHFNQRQIICASDEEARRLSALVASLDEYALVSLHGPAVVVRTAKSQSYRSMKREEFKRSKDDVLAYAWQLCGIDPETGNANAGAAA